MHSIRMRFGFLALAVYAVLGVVGVYSQSSSTATEASVSDTAALATRVEKARSSEDGTELNAEWHSFLPGAFK